MPSVIVTWAGRCFEDRKRQLLCSQLRELAHLSHSYFERPTPFRFFDGVLKGNILVSGALVPGYIGTEETRVRGHVPAASPGPIDIRLAGPQPRAVQVSEELFHISRVKVYGIEFRLYDGRHLYDGEDRISFVFADSTAIPELNGHLVHVEDQEQCRDYTSDLVKEADWFLTKPHIHLRDYCEDWMDILLGWVRYFHIPHLNYWRWQRLSGYQTCVEIWQDKDRRFTRDLVFEFLKHSFAKHVAEWRQTAREVSGFWEAMEQVRRQRRSE